MAMGLMAGGLEVGHEIVGERSADHGSAAEAHDGEAGGETGTVGEPLDERRYGGDVTEAETYASDEAVAEVEDRQRVQMDAEGRDEEAEAEAAGRDEHRLARTGGLKPLAEERGGDAEDGDGEGEDVADLLLRPRGADAGAEVGERLDEDAEGVGLPDGEVDGKRRGRDEPAAVAGMGDGARAVEEREEGS